MQEGQMIDDYLLMRRALLIFHTLLNRWWDYDPEEEGLLHGMADCYTELVTMGAAE